MVFVGFVLENKLSREIYLVLRKLVGKMVKVDYPVGDFLIRVKNAAKVRKRELAVSKAKAVKAVAKALEKEGFLESVTEKKGELIVKLAFRRKEPILLDLKLVSKPGLRIYMGVEELEKIKKPSILILSTSKGVVSSREALKMRLGGEVIVEVL